MHALQLLNDRVDLVERVLNLVVGIRWWQFKLQDEPIDLVEHDYEGNTLAHGLRD